MILWCAYCQRYQGEKPPFDCYELSHGSCLACEAAEAIHDAVAVKRAQVLKDYYRRLASAPDSGGTPLALLREGLAQGLDPWDLLMGLLQPSLYAMGERWARGEATVEDEHRHTAACAELVALAAEHLFTPSPTDAPPRVLLANVPGNTHRLGVALVELYLRSRRVSVEVVPGEPGVQALVEAARARRPHTLGLSCALPGQLAQALEVARALEALPEASRPRLAVGGLAARVGGRREGPLPFQLCTDPSQLLASVEER